MPRLFRDRIFLNKAQVVRGKGPEISAVDYGNPVS